MRKREFENEIEHLNEVVLCEACKDIVVDFFSNYDYDFSNDNETVMLCRPEPNEKIQCECCNNDIAVTSHYIITVPEHVKYEVADVLSEGIGGCEHCEGNDRASFVHSFNNDPWDRDSRIDFNTVRGDNAVLYVGEQKVPDELIHLFVELIICKCGYGREPKHPRHNPEGGVFEPYDDIYTRRDVNEFWGFDFKEFSEFGKQYDEEITHEDLLDFQNHLRNHPMLALRHPTGQVIFNILQKHFDAKAYSILNKDETQLYRGRTRKIDETALTSEQMWAPPPGKPQHGRYNSVGVPVIYVSDQLDAILYEIHPSNEELLHIVQVELLTDKLSIFDLESFDIEFQGFFSEKNEESSPLKTAYLLPNFIGTCCSFIGYNGVKYRGVHDSGSEGYMNYALFNVKPDIDLTISNFRTYNPKITYKMSEIPSIFE
ncbi:RES family NAD+ phosphorylase [Paenibacillus amylolyticus]|uniref:RES family NAD+ phosphorylase n=1 Tax=Paenibacillus amylolyticus TaxID=1451 RepID=UPI00201E6359|nr:RES family NAD+ phosphorylase [Paenibacillus amylolyticus]MCL6663513.1 RES family NAD+ phosphorylase [Paenibacillus amylolyticus]